MNFAHSTKYNRDFWWYIWFNSLAPARRDNNHENGFGRTFPYCRDTFESCITTAIWRCRRNFSQWQRSFQWKLRTHWLKVLRQDHVAVVIQDPSRNWLSEIWQLRNGTDLKMCQILPITIMVVRYQRSVSAITHLLYDHPPQPCIKISQFSQTSQGHVTSFWKGR